MATKISKDALDEIEKLTLSHYEKNAKSFWLGTRGHDVSQNIDAFLQALPKDKILDILDFGCGPGRDICTFKSLGHRPTGLDGSEAFCQMAHQHSGCNILMATYYFSLSLNFLRYQQVKTHMCTVRLSYGVRNVRCANTEANNGQGWSRYSTAVWCRQSEIRFNRRFCVSFNTTAKPGLIPFSETSKARIVLQICPSDTHNGINK